MTAEFGGGVKVHAKDGAVGYTTGGQRNCQLAGCPGKRLAVRWSDEKVTYPCTKGMKYEADGWKIQ